MKRLLVVSPHFPPVNAPDMHRVRISLPYFEEFGWKPHVVAVEPGTEGHVHDPDLLRSLPLDVSVTRVRALPAKLTRKIGIGNLALRAMPYLHAAGTRILRSERPDLVYFSTTMFPSMALGRIWKRRFGVPYVVDMQDPWLSSYYEDRPGIARPPKYVLAHRLDALLEPWTMRRVDGIVAVSDAYIAGLRRRYPSIDPGCCVTLPFGASAHDFEMLPHLRPGNRVFSRDDGRVHGVYVGRAGSAMVPALRILFESLRIGLQDQPEIYDRLRLHFVGTDYAKADRAVATVAPIAAGYGVQNHVGEQTGRVPYFQALQLLKDADFLIVAGSDDPYYTASKIFPYVLAKRPIVAILHAQSSAVGILNRLRAGIVVTFDRQTDLNAAAADLSMRWAVLLRRLPCEPDVDWAAFEPYSAREMTRRQCGLFDKVLSRTAD